jgi:hypothetical protein
MRVVAMFSNALYQTMSQYELLTVTYGDIAYCGT